MGFEQNFPNSSYSGTYDLRGNATEPLLASDAGVQVGYTIGTETANVIRVSCQFRDAAGVAIAYSVGVKQYLSTLATGLVTKTAATSLAVGTKGVILNEELSNTVWTAVSDATGVLEIDVGDASGVATYYLQTILPSGFVAASAAITFA